MKYNRLTYLREAGKNPHQKRLWFLQCDCGDTTTAVASQVRSGKTKSCGCLQAAHRASGNLKHGGKKHPLYATWCNMKARCDNEDHPQFKDYGGRGITYDSRWCEFPPFLVDVGEKPFPEATLDRIDNDGGYFPDNVRWADRTTQRTNSRQVTLVCINGETKRIMEWCKHYGISIGAVHRRLKRGMSIQDAITKPKAKRFQ